MLLRSSAVTLCTSAQISCLAPGGGGRHTTCQSPCWALTVPPSGACAKAGAAVQSSTMAGRRARQGVRREAPSRQARKVGRAKLDTLMRQLGPAERDPKADQPLHALAIQAGISALADDSGQNGTRPAAEKPCGEGWRGRLGGGRSPRSARNGSLFHVQHFQALPRLPYGRRQAQPYAAARWP